MNGGGGEDKTEIINMIDDFQSFLSYTCNLFANFSQICINQPVVRVIKVFTNEGPLLSQKGNTSLHFHNLYPCISITLLKLVTTVLQVSDVALGPRISFVQVYIK